MTPQKLLKGGDVASILNISRSKAFTMMAQGDIPSIRIGHCIRVEMEDLEKYIADNKKYDEKNYLKV